MNKINILPKEVYNRISAGEVVERPSSIVKELFENSVDAGAKTITIGIENGGINSIFIQDDGSGIAASEIEKVFMPHATSKISKASDLDSILTLGFRGEAMSSIASVSKIELSTNTENQDCGMKIIVEGGDIVSKTEEQCPIGTKISVTGIFYNTPARLKFLKTPKSEEGEVTTLVEKLILANPEISVKYFVNSKLVYQSFGDGLKNALIAIYHKNTIDNCCEISTIKNGMKIEGFLGNINFVKSNRAYQTLIVNGRYVTDSTISSAIQNAYSSYLMKRQYPFYVLSIVVPPEVVDVNVHPRKSEVRFQNNQIVYSSVYSVVSSTIDGSSRVLDIVKSTNSTIISDAFDKTLLAETANNAINNNDKNVAINEDFLSVENLAAKLDYAKLKAEVVAENPKKYVDSNGKVVYKNYENNSFDTYQKKLNVADHERVINANYTDDDFLSDLGKTNAEADAIFNENKKLILEQNKENSQQELAINDELDLVGQIFDTYLIFARGNEIYLVDQHAAHERIIYDRLLEKMKNRKVLRQQLLIPYCITVSPAEFELLSEISEYVEEMGIDMESAGENMFKIFSVPYEFVGMNIEGFFFDIINDEKFKDEKIPTVIREKLMQKACKSAIKAGDKLETNEIDALMAQLKNNFALKCPHGRPVAVRITRTEVDKWFKRIL